MDEESMPKELLKKILLIMILVFVQLLLFVHFIGSGIIIVLGLTLFMLIFLFRDRRLKIISENQILKQTDWYKSKYVLSEEIP